MIRLICVTAILYYATSAPVMQQAADSDAALVRTKRSEEAIMYGNHQNFARTKKASFHPMPIEEQNLDLASEARQETPAKTELTNTDDVKPVHELKQKDKAKSSEEETEDEKNERIEQLMSSDLINEAKEQKSAGDLGISESEFIKAEQGVGGNGGEEEEGLKKIAEESMMAHDGVRSEGLPIPDPAKITEEYQIVDEPTSGDGEGDAAGFKQEADPFYDHYDELSYDDAAKIPLTPNLFKSYREKRSAASAAKASANTHQVARAEDMMSASVKDKLGGRVKRDLDFPAEYSDSYPANFAGDYNDYPYYPEAENFEVERRAEGPGNWNDEESENDVEGQEMPLYDVDPRSYGESPGGYMLEDAPEMMGDINPEEMDMLRYLYEHGYGGIGDDQEVEYPADVEETWQDLGPAREVAYNPDPYEDQDQEQLTLPVEERLELSPSKRQYLSFVPGNRKRDANMFYPAQYGPDGRWGALVADPEREKRNELAEYERLYELAQALNGPAYEEMDKRYDSYLPAETYEDYWNRKRRK